MIAPSAFAAPSPTVAGSATPSTSSPSYTSDATSAQPHSAAPTDSTHSGNGESSKAVSGTDPSAYAVDLARYVFNVGFCQQQWADVQLVYKSLSLKLHRIMLARSPYLASVLLSLPIGSSFHLQLQDDNITEESVYICIQHLYTPTAHLVHETNARAMLATAFALGLPDLAEAAYAACRASISAATVIDHVRWLAPPPAAPASPGPNGFAHGLADGPAYSPVGTPGASTPPRADASWDGAPTPYGEYSTRLRQDVADFLLATLPAQRLAASARADGGGSPAPLHADPQLLDVYAHLPYDLFKRCVESPALPIRATQDRFAFAKKAIALRKKLAAAGGPSVAAGAGEESVVLGMGGNGMDVMVTRKAKRAKSALWKVEG